MFQAFKTIYDMWVSDGGGCESCYLRGCDEAWQIFANVSEQPAVPWSGGIVSTLKIKATGGSETSVSIFQSILYRIGEDSYFHNSLFITITHAIL